MMTSRQRSQDSELAHTKDLDHKITEELENLNNAAEEINTMELLLGEARSKFQEALTNNTAKLNDLEKKLGSCVEKSKKYYEARLVANDLQQELGAAALKFERANSQLMAAKEMVDLAEQGAMRDGNIFDCNWQEMLNRSTMKVNETENQKIASEAEHLDTANRYEEADREMKRLYRSLRRNINKSKLYFEAKNEFKLILDAHKSKVDVLQKNVKLAKEKYKAALTNLEMISSYIHQERQNPQERRESGVGAESSDVHPETPTTTPTTPPGSPQRPMSPSTPTSPNGAAPMSEITLEDLAIYSQRDDFCQLEREYDGGKLLLRARNCPPRRSASYDDGVILDPLAIMGPVHSVDHLDNMSDTQSYVSSEAISDQEQAERDNSLTDGTGLDSQFLEVTPSERGAKTTADPNDPVTSAIEVQEVVLEIPSEEVQEVVMEIPSESETSPRSEGGDPVERDSRPTTEELDSCPQEESTLSAEIEPDDETLTADS